MDVSKNIFAAIVGCILVIPLFVLAIIEGVKGVKFIVDLWSVQWVFNQTFYVLGIPGQIYSPFFRIQIHINIIYELAKEAYRRKCAENRFERVYFGMRNYPGWLFSVADRSKIFAANRATS